MIAWLLYCLFGMNPPRMSTEQPVISACCFVVGNTLYIRAGSWNRQDDLQLLIEVAANAN